MSVTLVVAAAASSGARDADAAQTLTFDQPRIVIGRGAHADVRLPSRAVSDTHVLIRLDAGQLSALDEASTNGTTVNGQPVVRGRKKALHSGDRLGVPGYDITVESSVSSADPPERTATVARRLLTDVLASSGIEASPPSLALVTGRRAGQRWVLPVGGGRVVAGRGETCEIVLDDVDCSRQHAAFERDDAGVIVRDLESKNGVFIAGRSVRERRLRDGDEVQLGRSVLAFSDPGEEALRALESGPDELPDPVPVISRESRSTPIPEPGSPPDASPSPSPPPQSAPAPLSPTPEASPPRPSATIASTSSPPTARRARPHGGHAADWIVVLLAIVILGISAAALWVLLHGTPVPR